MVRLHRHVIRLAERIREIILLVAVFGVVVFGVEQRPHPDAGLVSIYAFAKACRFNQDIDVAVSLNGVESGVTYRITLGLAQPGLAEDGYVVFQANSEFLPCCQVHAPNTLGGGSRTSFTTTRREPWILPS